MGAAGKLSIIELDGGFSLTTRSHRFETDALPRGAAATGLDYMSLQLDDSHPVVLEGKLLCRDCQLKKQYGYQAICTRTGHHGWLATSDGRLWSILEGDDSQDLIHNASLLGREVKIQGRIFRRAGSIEVTTYQLL